MPVAVQMEDVDSRFLELLQEEVETLLSRVELFSQSPEAPPVKLLQCVVEVASGHGESGPCCHLEVVADAQPSWQGAATPDTHRSYSR